uniref:Uncharacterized protein n=1 Tax=Plectus sambesii TaxID=2011161 RepID=A0A914VKR1_9BILA
MPPHRRRQTDRHGHRLGRLHNSVTVERATMAAASSDNRDSSAVSDMLDSSLQHALQTTLPPTVPKKGPVEQLLSLNTLRRWVREKTGYALFGEVRLNARC